VPTYVRRYNKEISDVCVIWLVRKVSSRSIWLIAVVDERNKNPLKCSTYSVTKSMNFRKKVLRASNPKETSVVETRYWRMTMEIMNLCADLRSVLQVRTKRHVHTREELMPVCPSQIFFTGQLLMRKRP
jgi:hypothetical protein